MPTIHKLPETVINRIAAGEIIARPENLIKEIIENSIDAQASHISITIYNSPFNKITIEDNGVGIHPDDLPLLCERFATSKLTSMEDLMSIQTHGFRGEALASISHISRISVITKQTDSVFAYSASYLDGKLLSSKKQAGRNGTIICVEDLFYNYPGRRKALKINEETTRIVNIITSMAIQNANVSFKFSKHGSAVFLSTLGISKDDCIKQIYGQETFNALMPIEGAILHGEISGYISKRISAKTTNIWLFFINGRLVENKKLKKAITLLYNKLFPHSSEVIILSINLDPTLIDVNMHPSKTEILILDEEEVIESIISRIEEKLCSESAELINQQKLKTPESSQVKSPTRIPYRSRIQPNIAPLDAYTAAVQQSYVSNLASIKCLLKYLQDGADNELQTLLVESCYIGATSTKTLAIQIQDSMYLTKSLELLNSVICQKILRHFEAFSERKWTITDLGISEIPLLPSILQEKKQQGILSEYFAINITKTYITLPVIFTQDELPLEHIQSDLWVLFEHISTINWSNEIECLWSIIILLGKFYTAGLHSLDMKTFHSVVDIYIWPYIRSKYTAQKKHSFKLVRVATLKGLYKVFERC